jgi:CRISPR/Cas system endoribonuclease Cas6 (RAMP superfamily)
MPIHVVMNEFLMVKTRCNFIQLQTEKQQFSPLEDLYRSQDLIGLLEPLQLKFAKYLFDKHVTKMIASCVFLDDSHIRMAKLRSWVILQFAQVLSSVSGEVVRAIKTEHRHRLFLVPSTLVLMFTKSRNCKTIVQ